MKTAAAVLPSNASTAFTANPQPRALAKAPRSTTVSTEPLGHPTDTMAPITATPKASPTSRETVTVAPAIPVDDAGTEVKAAVVVGLEERPSPRPASSVHIFIGIDHFNIDKGRK